MRRLDDGFLKEYLKYSSNTEVPSIFTLWCGISCISVALGRDAWIDMGHYTIYPNMYIVLVAGSAKCKKSTAIRIAEREFIKNIDPPIKIYSQKLTPEALIGALSETEQTGETMIGSSAVGIIIVDELSTLIDRNAFQSGMIPFLTTLWDASDAFTYETKRRGKETVYNSCVSILGGSTLSWIREAVPTSAVGGGFTSRVVFVYREDHENPILWTTMTDENRERAKNLVHDLNQVAQIRGQFVVDKKAMTFSEELYQEFVATHPFYADKFLAGYAGRRFTTLLKLAMVISTSMSDSRCLTIEDINVANNILKNVELQMPKVLKAIAMDDVGIINTDVLSIIETKGIISRRQLLTLVHHTMQSRDLDVILETLIQAGKVKQLAGEGRGIEYKITVKKKKESFTDAILDKEGEKK